HVAGSGRGREVNPAHVAGHALPKSIEMVKGGDVVVSETAPAQDAESRANTHRAAVEVRDIVVHDHVVMRIAHPNSRADAGRLQPAAAHDRVVLDQVVLRHIGVGIQSAAGSGSAADADSSGSHVINFTVDDLVRTAGGGRA